MPETPRKPQTFAAEATPPQKHRRKPQPSPRVNVDSTNPRALLERNAQPLRHRRPRRHHDFWDGPPATNTPIILSPHTATGLVAFLRKIDGGSPLGLGV